MGRQPFVLMYIFVKYLFLVLIWSAGHSIGVSWTHSGATWHHPLKDVEDNLFNNLAQSDDSHFVDFNSTLNEILIPRVPDTETHTKVRQYILRQMNALGWTVTQDQFINRTPYGQKKFANIMATADPTACRSLVIACHYDTLYNREFTFLGATDSAVPCAMMIHTARLLNPLLQQQKSESKKPAVTLQYIFFDGEEAFRRWSRTDSLYGSRHLADKWNSQRPFDNEKDRQNCMDKEYVSYLDRIDAMILLDLLGAPNPKFYSYFLDTHKLYQQFADIELRLNNIKEMEVQPPESNTRYFTGGTTLAYIEDDHVPFMKRGVPIVHLIPSPFPHVWHKETDNRQNLHHPTINNLNKILRTFLVQYLHLDIPNKKLTV